MDRDEIKQQIKMIIGNIHKPYIEVEEQLQQLCNQGGCLDYANTINALIDTIGDYHSLRERTERELYEAKQLRDKAWQRENEERLRADRLAELLAMEQIKNKEYLRIIEEYKTNT